VTNPVGISGSPLDAKRATPLGEAEQWQSHDYLVPGILLMYAASYAKGTADGIGRRAPSDHQL
jgi:hypothetical protein